MWRDLLWFDAGYTAALVIGNPLYGFLAIFVAYASMYVPLVGVFASTATTTTPTNVALLSALAGSAAGLVALKTYGAQFPATVQSARALAFLVPLQITVLDILFPSGVGIVGSLIVAIAYIGFNLAVFSLVAPTMPRPRQEGALDFVRFLVLATLNLLWSAWSQIAPSLFAIDFYRMYVLNMLTLAVLVFDSVRRQRLQREAAQSEALRAQQEEEARRAFEAENRDATQYVAQLVERDRSGKGRKMKKRLAHAQREYEARVSAASAPNED